MNNVSLIGRLTRNPEVRYAQSNSKAVARFSLAVDRIGEGADFINIVAFDKTAEFIEKYFKKGMKIALTGHINTGSYDDKDGKKVYTTDVIADRVEFCESKNASSESKDSYDPTAIPDGIEDEIPFV